MKALKKLYVALKDWPLFLTFALGELLVWAMALTFAAN